MSFFLHSCDDVEIYNFGYCVRTGGTYYSNNEYCRIEVLQTCRLFVLEFDTEYYHDELSLDGTAYSWSGTSSPDGIDLSDGDYLIFDTDGSVVDIGFDFCCYAMNFTQSPTDFTQSPSDLPPNPTDPPMREDFELVGGSSDNEGNVYLNGQPICDDNWDHNDANVVCRKLGYEVGLAVTFSRYGYVPVDFIMNDVDCDGDEYSIWVCGYSTHVDDCFGYEGAGAICGYSSSESWFVIGPVLIFCIVGSVCIFACICFCYCHVKGNRQRNAQNGVVIQGVSVADHGNQNVHRLNTPEGPEGVVTQTHDEGRPARLRYKPTRTNMFDEFHRTDPQPEAGFPREGHAEGGALKSIELSLYEPNSTPLDTYNLPSGSYRAEYGDPEGPPPEYSPPPYVI